MRISRRLFLTRFMTILSGVIFIDVLFERFSIKFKEYHLNSNPEITHLKAIQISDLHLKKLRFHHDAMCKRIENSHPDLLLLTGDLVDDAKNLPELESFLKLLPLATPKFAVLGNWEYWGGVAISELQRTHGGQINFFGFVPFLPQGSGRFVGGWYTVGKHNLYVSKGIGTSILPIRFGARAEIAIFNF